MANVTSTATNVRPAHNAMTEKGTYVSSSDTYLGRTVYKTNDGWKLTDGNAAASVAGVIGVIVYGHWERNDGKIVENEEIDVVVFGRVFGFSSLVGSETLYLSDDAGRIADAAGSNSRSVGYAYDAQTLFVLPSANDY